MKQNAIKGFALTLSLFVLLTLAACQSVPTEDTSAPGNSDPPAVKEEPLVAYQVSYPISVNGTQVNFDAYALRDESGNDTNYLKLRDVATALDGTKSQFDVGWDGSAITIATGISYISKNGTEMSVPFVGDQPYAVNSSAVKIDGREVTLDAILLTDAQGNGYTYFKLRDLGAALGFDVDWTPEAGIGIQAEMIESEIECRDIHWAEAYAATVAATFYSNSRVEWSYDLIYLNNDNIPELVASVNGYHVSLFTYANGKVYTLMDQWGYGAGGNHGYEYVPCQNVVYNLSADYAGMIYSESYYKMGKDHTMVSCVDEPLSIWYFLDENGNGIPDDNEAADEDYVSYHYGNRQITETEYQLYGIAGDYQFIEGTKSQDQILSDLYKIVDREAPREDYGDIFSLITQRNICWTAADDDLSMGTFYFSDKGTLWYEGGVMLSDGEFAVKGNCLILQMTDSVLGAPVELEVSAEPYLENGRDCLRLTCVSVKNPKDPSATAYSIFSDGVYRLYGLTADQRSSFDYWSMGATEAWLIGFDQYS